MSVLCLLRLTKSLLTSELGSVMKKLGENPTENQLLELVNKFDEDGNGTIEFSEFLIMMTTKVKMNVIKNIYRFYLYRLKKRKEKNQKISFHVALDL